MWSIFLRGCSPPDSAGAWRSLACLSPSARSGCSTSRRPRSTPPRKARLPPSCGRIWKTAESLSPRPTRRSDWRTHKSCGSGPQGKRRREGFKVTPALALFVREWRIARRIGGGASVGAVFFLILVAVMPFALGPDLNLLARLGPAILWIAAPLAHPLWLDRLFQADHEDGSLDILVNGLLPLEIAVLVKCAAHWTASALPLIVVSPLFGLMLAMTPLPLMLVAATLAAGTPALTMIGGIGAALTVSLRRGGLLMAVLVLPLTIPVLIFGVAAASAASGGSAPFRSPFLILCALSLAAVAGAPFAAAAALRQVRE